MNASEIPLAQPTRTASPERLLRRSGVVDPKRATQLLADPVWLDLLGGQWDHTQLITALSHAADPDQALLSLVRIAEVVSKDSASRVMFTTLFRGEVAALGALCAVLGVSQAFADELVRRPELIELMHTASADLPSHVQMREDLLRAVAADPADSTPIASSRPLAEQADALRREYRRQLLQITIQDVTHQEPAARLGLISAALADLASAAIDAAVATARSQLPPEGQGIQFAVIGMGKTGARELNYVSDVDVMYIVAPTNQDADQFTHWGTRLATIVARVCSGTFTEPPLWKVDAGLRPEGAQGPLVRTVESYLRYYERWAHTWEFQALLKARPIGGDAALGAQYCSAIEPLIWSAAQREHFVEETQAMRRRVEAHIPQAHADRQLKLGQGGLRDVEFTVQLLQLVHGRTDPQLRARDTLSALAALRSGGYIGRDHAERLADCYRFLRTIEHRIQLHRLQRSHLIPTAEEDLRRVARGCGLVHDPVATLMNRWNAIRREVRSIHENLFYRPLLPATAQLSPQEVTLAPDVAQARLSAMGYRDPHGALRHIAALTDGVSRRAAIQRQLLPVMLGWFAEGSDPDAGLLAFRHVSDQLGRTHWYLKLLRDSGSAAHRLARLLAGSQYIAEALARSPEAITWLDDDADLAPPGLPRLHTQAQAAVERVTDPMGAVTGLRSLRRREMNRVAAAQLLGKIDISDAQAALSDTADVLLVHALALAEKIVQERNPELLTRDGEAPAAMLMVALGRLGGREMTYRSDADVIFVCAPQPSVEPELAQRYAVAVVTQCRRLVSSPGTEPSLAVDVDLRPEGRSGALVRSFDSYAEYYLRWSSPWEAQALLRARPLGEASDHAEQFTAMIDPLRYPIALSEAAVREIRRLKARMEAERLPRGAEPTRHLKLGRGGMSDVEWTIQLIQLRHAQVIPELQTTATLEALNVAASAGLLKSSDAEVLRHAWTLASSIRAGIVLWRGSGAAADVLPHERRDLNAIARILEPEDRLGGQQLEQRYLRATRRARQVMERLFYG